MQLAEIGIKLWLGIDSLNDLAHLRDDTIKSRAINIEPAAGRATVHSLGRLLVFLLLLLCQQKCITVTDLSNHLVQLVFQTFYWFLSSMFPLYLSGKKLSILFLAGKLCFARGNLLCEVLDSVVY